MEQIRTFVAIELPAEVKTLLGRLQSRLRSGHGGAVKWVDPEGVHLTLHFLGEVPAERLPAIEQALRQAVRGIRPAHLETGDLGAFPSFQRPRVVWVGIEGEREWLQALKAAVDAALHPLGFAPEERAFSPHLTLGRVRSTASPAEVKDLGVALRATAWHDRASLPIRTVNLMRSDLSPAGARYQALAVIDLEG